MKDADTKTRILDAAEKLFASNGFGAVSLRAIIKEAGVNTASVHYHFGSKGGLMEAVLRRRAAPMNTERLRLLDGIESNHPTGVLPIEEVIEAFLAPAIRRHRGPARDRGLLPRLMGRAITEPDQVVSKAIRNIFEDVFERFSAAFARALPELSVEEIQLRLHFVVGALAFTVAGPYAFEDKAPSIRDHDVDHITRSLVSFVAAGLRASVNSKIKDKESR